MQPFVFLLGQKIKKKNIKNWSTSLLVFHCYKTSYIEGEETRKSPESEKGHSLRFFSA